MNYKIGEIRQSKNWGAYQLLEFISGKGPSKCKIQFLESLNIYEVALKEYNTGSICDNIRRENEILNKEYPQYCGDILKILKKTNIQKYKELSYFYEAEFQKYPYKIIARLTEIQSGNCINPLIEQKEFIEKEWLQNCGDSLKIIKKSDKRGYWICQFIKYKSPLIEAQKSHIIRGAINNKNIPIIYKVGYIGYGKYNYSKYPKFYKLWNDILKRCYEENKQNSYLNVTVCKEWLNFQNFAAWYEENSKWNTNNLKTELDKDALFNIKHLKEKIYSPNSCLVLPENLNGYLSCDNLNNGVQKINDKKYLASFELNKKYYREYFSSFKEAKKYYADIKYEKWKTLIEISEIPDYLKEILLKYDFNWSWL